MDTSNLSAADAALVRAAAEARPNAYARYSRYQVGAALEADDGRIFVGVNVENLSFGATICAERTAAVSMVAAGGRGIRRVAVVTADGVTPCGICLQVLAEFADAADQVEILCYALDSGVLKRFRLADLMPHGFRTEKVDKAT